MGGGGSWNSSRSIPERVRRLRSVDSGAGELSVSVPGPHLLGTSCTPLPGCGNQKCLQTLPSVSSLTKLSRVESHCPRLYFPIATIKNYRKLSSLKKHRFLLLWLWRSEVQKSRCRQGSRPSRSSRENPFPRLFRLLEAAASWACGTFHSLQG